MPAAAFTRLEWDTLLTSDRADLALEELVKSGTLEGVFPELYALVGFGGEGTGHKDLWDHTKIVVRQTLPRAMLRWASLFHDCGKPACFSEEDGEISFHGHEVVSARLFREAARRSGLFSVKEIKDISSIIRLLGRVEQYSPTWSDSAVRRLARDFGELAQDVLAVARADCSSAKPHRRRAAQARCHALKVRLEALAERDAILPLLPRGLGFVVMKRLGVDGPMTPEQLRDMKRIMDAFRGMVEKGELPRSGDFEVYLAKLPELLQR